MDDRNEAENHKALSLLIHDVRAPLSVAQGYLRLIRDERLPSEEDRRRALDQTMTALGRIARLCSEASAFTADVPDSRAGDRLLDARALVDQVAHACTAREGPAVVVDVPDSARIGLVRAPQENQLAESIATILAAVHRSAAGSPVHVETDTDGHELRFLLGDADARHRLVRAADSRPADADGPARTFDAWRGGHGLALPLACRLVAALGGRIWSAADTRGAVAIALPQELT